MPNFKRYPSQFPVGLAFLILWVSFAWGLPADAPAAGGEADVAPKDRWAGVRISDAYDDLRCPYCWGYNELTAARCPSCGHEFPQPSAEYTYPPWVFVPGMGYYREGTLLEPGKSRKGLWITGLAIMGSGFFTLGVAAEATEGLESPGGFIVAYIAAPIAIGVGAVLLIVGLATRTEAVYAFTGGERCEPHDSAAYARRSRDSEGEGLKIEVTVLGFNSEARVAIGVTP